MLDTIRHLEVFAPESFGEQRIDVVGVGATGSRIALELAKLGISNIHVWDDDCVEPHNVPNQVYGNHQIGQLKVDALQAVVLEQTGTNITTHAERVSGIQPLGDVVFLLTDTMASRREIWMIGLRYKVGTRLMIETRMGRNSGRVYTVSPSNPAHVGGWEESLYADDVAEVSACGTSITVGATAATVTGLAVWQFIRWHQMQQELKNGDTPTDEVENELVFSLQPMMIATMSW